MGKPLKIEEEKLLRDPYSFFFASDAGGWGTLFGNDIFAKINLHLYKIALGHIKPLNKEMNSSEAVRKIKQSYKAAIPQNLKLISNPEVINSAQPE